MSTTTVTPHRELTNRAKVVLTFVTLIEQTGTPRADWVRHLTGPDADRLWAALAAAAECRPNYVPSATTKAAVVAHLAAADLLAAAHHADDPFEGIPTA